MTFLLDPSNWDITLPNSIPNLFLAHVWLTAVSVGIGLLIAFPIALLVARFRPLYAPVTTFASVLYTIPSIAAMVLLIPITHLEAPTVIIPLVAYTQIVLIRNIVAAVRAVDPSLVEVGRAMGMNAVQIQTKVVLPLALPVIIAGIRVVVVTTIGIASISQIVGVSDLGTLVFQGQTFAYNDEIIAGAILITALAVGADLLLLGVQRLLGRGQATTLASAG
ncbi:MAG TPA: ABC transporter permease [Ktedonobacterales bacterium]|nr:ABC transporter permease [Ktedonobacterales bacterium]